MTRSKQQNDATNIRAVGEYLSVHIQLPDLYKEKVLGEVEQFADLVENGVLRLEDYPRLVEVTSLVVEEV